MNVNSKTRKRLRHVPVHYDELKKKRTINLTDTSWEKINKIADSQSISASELIERWGRNLE
ncbi:hypothetical protein G7B40_033655 [Aetokthonos hydrillicola Thurmond2011]|jgi:predicted DNA-binding ribbon-helix-helix protein|uniref:Uncharacterized protein n=1 Tax=Aetokthonos hydrillicola Thurmond2011 TaxID=2712845 RepID=A0AAP5ID71_9CYAN|nr:hypothetical protein [Aetokthonos hydrillicola]MBO3459698.1 hypothetical protein [Aetokthonos hydrillicola CCALA 1050]MBW4588548.1 hypothetical protein [Aetokthonos hydrillicola CCALA 1050]MDR9899470.1 hypothetical protein [Aetokthonos hydrillicola Thurmond2011]